jgi:L-fucono-1,5-lactonase
MGNDMSEGRPNGARRRLLAAGLALAGAYKLRAAPALKPVPIIDTHIHLFDPNRPQGAPYVGPPGSSANREGAFPKRYEALVRPLGVVGAIAVEASPWIEDNLWLLQTANASDLIVGVVGNLRPESTDFAELLARFAKNPLFRGIRYGNLWNYDLVSQSKSEKFLGELRRLADADLVLEAANPRIDLLQAILRVNDAIPALRIVIDHLPHWDPAHADVLAYQSVLNELKQRQQLFAKLSAVIHPIDGQTRTDLQFYRARLDLLYETFGEDRVMFGSDWPNSDGSATPEQSITLMRQYFSSKPGRATEKYFWANSMSVYKWLARAPDQPAIRY